MKILNQVKKEGSKYAVQYRDANGTSTVIGHELYAQFVKCGFIKGNLLLVECETVEAINPETKAPVGNRVIGVVGAVAENLVILQAKQDSILATKKAETEMIS